MTVLTHLETWRKASVNSFPSFDPVQDLKSWNSVKLFYWAPGRPSTQKCPWWHFEEGPITLILTPPQPPSSPRWPRPSPTAAQFKCRFTCGQLKEATGGAPGPVGWPRWSQGGKAGEQVPPSPQRNLLTHTPFPGRSGRGLQPFARLLLMRFENLWARWREPDPRSEERRWGGGQAGRGGHGGTAALITSDVNPQNNVQESGSPHGEVRLSQNPSLTYYPPKKGLKCGFCLHLFNLMFEKRSFKTVPLQMHNIWAHSFWTSWEELIVIF